MWQGRITLLWLLYPQIQPTLYNHWMWVCWANEKMLAEALDRSREKQEERALTKVFSRLLKQLSHTSMKRHHFEGAFRGSVLYPRPEAAAIPQSKLAPSEAVKQATKSSTNSPCPSEATQSSTNSPRSGTQAVKFHLKHHFSKLFQTSMTPILSSRSKPFSCVDVAYYGEVITSHEACTRITQQEERKLQCAQGVTSSKIINGSFISTGHNMGIDTHSLTT